MKVVLVSFHDLDADNHEGAIAEKKIARPLNKMTLNINKYQNGHNEKTVVEMAFSDREMKKKSQVALTTKTTNTNWLGMKRTRF